MYISLCSLLNIVIVKPKSLAPPRLLPSFWARPKSGGGQHFCVAVQLAPSFPQELDSSSYVCCEDRVAS